MDAATESSVARHIRRAVAGLVLLVVPACQIPNFRPPGSPPVLPANFNGLTTPDNAAQLRVDEFFNDPDLVRLLCQGLAGNQQLKILEQDIRIAQNEVLFRRGALFPLVSLRAGAGLNRSSEWTPEGAAERQLFTPRGKPFPDPLPDFLVAANVSWQIDIWRKLRNARDAASLRYLATADGRNYVVTRLVADIAENYFTLMALDQRMATLDLTIAFQEKSRQTAQLQLEAGRGTQLAVQRFTAEVRKNQSEKLVVRQDIIEAENRINFMLGRFPQRVERNSDRFLELTADPLRVGLPAQLLLNRPDVRQAEKELAAAGLEVKVARAEFFPQLDLTGGAGYRAFNPKYLFNPEAFVGNVAGELVAPLVNKAAIRAAYGTANARQLQRLYEYQRTVLDAYTEVVNRVSQVESYRASFEVKRQQLAALESSVDLANKLFQAARGEYLDILLAQRDYFEARQVLIETKRQQLVGVVNAYQALGGGGNLEQYLEACMKACPPGPPAPPRPQLLPQLEPMSLEPKPALLQLPFPQLVPDPTKKAPDAAPLPEPKKAPDAPPAAEPPKKDPDAPPAAPDQPKKGPAGPPAAALAPLTEVAWEPPGPRAEAAGK